MKYLVAVVCLWATTSLAHAEVAPHAVVVVGGAKPHEVALVVNSAGDVFREAGWQISLEPVSERDVKLALGCSPSEMVQGCAGSLLRARQANRLAVFSLVFDVHTRELLIAGKLFATGVARVPSEQRYCAQCTDDTLQASTRELAAALLEQLAIAEGRTVLEVTSTPAGARVFVDDELVGMSNLRTPMAPGLHRVRLVVNGFHTVERVVLGSAGVTTQVEVVLEPLAGRAAPAQLPQPADVAAPHGRMANAAPPSRLGPALLMSGGGALLLAGAVALALHEEDPIAPAHQPQTEYYTPTLVPGVLTVATGAVLVGSGYWWWRARSRRAATAAVLPLRQGVLLGWLGTF